MVGRYKKAETNGMQYLLLKGPMLQQQKIRKRSFFSKKTQIGIPFFPISLLLTGAGRQVGRWAAINLSHFLQDKEREQEPWSSGYGKRLTFRRFESRHRILDGHFFTYICCENCNVGLKRPKINEKEAWVGPKKESFKN